MSTTGPTVIVSCEGPPDWTHECFVVACYRQYLVGATPAWIPQRRWEHRGRRGYTRTVQQFHGPDGRPQANQDIPVEGGWVTIRLRCKECGYDWCRRTDIGPDVVAAMFAVFDGVAAAGRDDISVRGLTARM
jgi:ribosomal protein L44E